jgi:dipeptidyl aminopeptidase/acylaminoacyl peptidase
MKLIEDELLQPSAERTLDVYILRPDDDRRHATALLVAGSKNGANVWKSWGKQLAEQGIAVVGVAQPGFGRSDGRWDFAGAPTQAALLALLAWTRNQPWVDPRHIALGGYSSGATNALLLAARYDSVAVVGAAGIYDLNHWVATSKHHFVSEMQQALGDQASAQGLRQRSPIHLANRIRCPVRLIHGGKDEVVPPDQAEVMAAALAQAGNAPDLEIFPERGHSALPAQPFVEFLLEWLLVE